MQTQTISIFGLGYVGCVSAACFAQAGHKVIGVDLNAEKVRLINAGKSPIVEPGLDTLLSSMVAASAIRATESCEEAIQESDTAFICVGTPGNEHGQLQLTALHHVSREIGRSLKSNPKPYTVVVRSTVLPGTTMKDIYSVIMEEAGEELRNLVKVAVNPEFIREGTALKDFAEPPFTLVGCEGADTVKLLRSLYSQIDAPFIATEIKTAETIKYVSNTYHALKVCFANEVGNVCDSLGVDSQEVMRIFRMDTKLNVSPAYLRPGFAFGGSCLPKDVRAFRYAASHLDVATPLLNAIIPSNEGQIQRAIDTIMTAGGNRIGFVGLSFKPDTDDLRESPLVRVVEALLGKGKSIRILDGNVSIAKLVGANRHYITKEIPHISMLMCESPQALLDHALVLVIGTDGLDAAWVMQNARPEQIIVDLTQSWPIPKTAIDRQTRAVA